MTRMNIHDGGFNARSAFGDHVAVTAGGAGDATESNGVWVDREAEASGMAMSAKLIIAYEAVLADTKSLSLAVNIQDDAAGDGGDPADFGTAYANTVIVTSSGGTTERGTVELDFDLSAARRYVRSQVTPDLSASGTDTAQIVATWVFFGAPRGPMSESVI